MCKQFYALVGQELRDPRKRLGATALLVVFLVILAYWQGHSTASLGRQPLEEELKQTREVNVKLSHQVLVTTRELTAERLFHTETQDELERVKKQTRTVTREVFSPAGQIQERVTDVRTSDVTTRRKHAQVQSATESTRVAEAASSSIVSVAVSASESVSLFTRNDTRTGAGLGAFASLEGVGLLATYRVLGLGPLGLEAMAGAPAIHRPALGLGVGLELTPRFSLGAGLLAEPLALKVYPALSLTHRF